MEQERIDNFIEADIDSELLDKADEEARVIKVEDLENQEQKWGEEKEYEQFQ